MGFLDAWIGEEAARLRGEVGEKLEKWQELDRRLASLRGSRREREQKVDLLSFQVGEIEAVGLRVGELAELESRLARLKHAEQLAETVAHVRQALVEGEPAGRDLVTGSAKLVEEAERLDPSLGSVREPLEQAGILLEEALAELRVYEDSVDASPGMLEETASRMDSIKRLLRKYGDDESAVLEFFERSKAELELLTGDESGEESLAGASVEALQELQEACARLSALRKAKADAFSAQVQVQLRDLAMEKARFEVGFQAQEPDATGADAAEFLFSANTGESLRPLSKIASGGEISRAMLAIKTALIGKAGVPTLIFDEVDTGLGGRAAATVARKLEELARHDQVIVITHLPQIAGRATAHFRVEKGESAGRVTAAARPLAQCERVEEIARMLAGEEVGESALAHARELLG